MASEILLVIAGGIAMTVLAAAYYLVTPLFLNIQQNPNADCQANANCMAIFNRQYDVWFILFELFTGGVILSLYIRAVRRDSVETVSDF